MTAEAEAAASRRTSTRASRTGTRRRVCRRGARFLLQQHPRRKRAVPVLDEAIDGPLQDVTQVFDESRGATRSEGLREYMLLKLSPSTSRSASLDGRHVDPSRWSTRVGQT